MNKGHRDFLRWKSCERKARFQTEAAAKQKGQRAYLCPICKHWHRTSNLAGYAIPIDRR